MNNFSNRPFGVSSEIMPNAEVYHISDTKALPDNGQDAFYFHLLEQSGVFLNEAQLKAVRHTEGPCLTLAGAGSGKTSVLVSRTGYLLQVAGVPPESILLLTFSKKAAMEMKQRVSLLPNINRGASQQNTSRYISFLFPFYIKEQGHETRDPWK